MRIRLHFSSEPDHEDPRRPQRSSSAPGSTLLPTFCPATPTFSSAQHASRPPRRRTSARGFRPLLFRRRLQKDAGTVGKVLPGLEGARSSEGMGKPSLYHSLDETRECYTFWYLVVRSADLDIRLRMACSRRNSISTRGWLSTSGSEPKWRRTPYSNPRSTIPLLSSRTCRA